MLTNTLSRFSGPFLVVCAAFLWATDALVRYPAIENLDPTFIVFMEHFLAVLVLLPRIWNKYKNQALSLSLGEWMSAVFCGVGGSAIATVLFTASFLYVNPSVTILLQKLQPVLVVCIAYAFIGERPAKKFYFWGLVALGAGIVLSFPDLNFNFLNHKTDLHSQGINYAFGAALLWAASTVAGKNLLKRTPPLLATFWRFFFGLIALSVLLYLGRSFPSVHSLKSTSLMVNLVYLSLVPGLFAMIAYYSGLARTPASVTTFIELVYPIAAVILNTFYLHTTLDPVQMAAGLVLVIAVAVISI